ncbi:hypothetical protein A3F65_00710 [Candidatus Saccharibacteria bacterium RIFCSPHIGHO2_12_FULL_47_16b]|nr:MAG: hypothetical protein A3F65_00710 [Candidatus Saccharibacteria bacterium RIFCSPHIGHO2_12_FULL_47_16b]
MSVAEIQDFMNSKVPVCDTNGTQPYTSGSSQTRAEWAVANGKPQPPYTCLKSYSDSTIGWPAETSLCNAITGRTGNAAEIIYWVSNACGINPQVLLVLLQKEQSLVTDDWPWPYQYRFATGYCVYDVGPPPPSCAGTEGFFGQVYYAARQFKRYARDVDSYNFRAGINNMIRYSPDPSCGESQVYIQNQGTANLYNYTPYQPNAAALSVVSNSSPGGEVPCGAYGNRNFWWYFTKWFGSTLGPPDYSCKEGVNFGGGLGPRVVVNQFSPSGNATFTLSYLNQTISKCIELHTWQPNLQSWVTNVATNHPAIPPPNAEIIAGNIYGDARSELILVLPRTSVSGKIEVHTWDNTYQHWITNIATNHALIPPEDFDVVPADVNGDGRDELLLVLYRNTGSGKVEIHEWNPGLQTWAAHTATNLPAIDPADGRVIAANLYGSAADELVYVKYRNTGSAKIEVHTWAGGQQSWLANIATNLPLADINPDDIEIVAGNIYDGAIDELTLVKYRNTGSGKIEIHTWAAGQQVWLSQMPTNLDSLSP